MPPIAIQQTVTLPQEKPKVAVTKQADSATPAVRRVASPAASRPVEAGAALPLHLRACEENSWEPAGTAEVVPVLPDGRVGGALVRCVLGGEDVRRLQEARATVFAARRQTIDDELPDVAAYRLLLDVPAWLGAAAQAAEGVRMLARDGRSPTLHLHG